MLSLFAELHAHQRRAPGGVYVPPILPEAPFSFRLRPTRQCVEA